MDIETLRLKLVEIVHSPAQQPADTVNRARELEQYIREPVKGRPRKADKQTT